VAALQVEATKEGAVARCAAATAAAEGQRTHHEAALQACRADAAADKAASLAALAASVQGSLAEAARLEARAQALYVGERTQRAALHERVMELQGNIRVFARCRPRVPNDGGADPEEEPSAVAVVAVHPELLAEKGFGEELQVRDVRAGYDRGGLLRFEFDACFGPLATQAQVFEQVRPLVTSFLDGYNVCIFAYGQTGSGKTHTMEGGEGSSSDGEAQGINLRTLREAFAVAAERAAAGATGETFKFSAEYLEVYQEHVRDLLADGDDDPKRPSLEVRQTKSGHVFAEGLTSVGLKRPEDLEAVVALGARRRSVGSHRLNAHSSRSHALLTFTCEATSAVTSGRTSTTTVSRLHLVDLAGSERVAKTEASGEQLKEASAINKSLAALGDVIQALGAKKSSTDRQGPPATARGHAHVPFRNSKLTYLLQNSLTGAAKVLMVCCAAPTASHASETVCSLNFAGRCRAVQLGAAHKTDKCKRLEERILDLETQLRDKENDATAATAASASVGLSSSNKPTAKGGSGPPVPTAMRRHALAN
jgi:kinesin family protein C2/C3